MKRILLAAPLAAAVIVTGCSAPATPPAPSTTTAGQPTQGSTGQVTPSQPASPSDQISAATPGSEVDKAAFGDVVAASGEKTKSAHMQMGMEAVATQGAPSITMSLSGDVDNTDPDRPRAALKMSGMLDMDVVVDGTDYYLKMAPLGDEWYKATEADLQANGESLPDPADQAEQTRTMVNSADRVVYVGEEAVDGVQTRHYTAYVPRSAITGENATATPSPGAEDPVEPVEIYLGVDDDIMRRTSYNIEDGKAKINLVMSRINEPVTITVPTNAKPLPKA